MALKIGPIEGGSSWKEVLRMELVVRGLEVYI